MGKWVSQSSVVFAKKKANALPLFPRLRRMQQPHKRKAPPTPPQYVWVETHNCQSKAKETAVTDRTTVEAREREKLHCVSVSFLDVSAKDGGGEEERE